MEDVDLARAHPLDLLGGERGARVAEADDEAVEVRGVVLPVAGVPDERDRAPALPALDEERPASDPPAVLGIVDSTQPDLREVFAPERMGGKDAWEKAAPAGETRAEDHSDRRRVD